MCEDCGIREGCLVIGPYTYELFDIEVERMLCKRCYGERVRDI